MEDNRNSLDEMVPEADFLEQQTWLDPQSVGSPVAAVADPGTSPETVDDADRLEQATALLDDHEDDYPRESPDA